MQIMLQNLKRTYGTLHAVNGISLSIPSNTIYGIIGKSGAGKSTLVRLISDPMRVKSILMTSVSITSIRKILFRGEDELA